MTLGDMGFERPLSAGQMDALVRFEAAQNKRQRDDMERDRW